MIKNFIYDVETTGTNPRRNGIHQISAIVEIDGSIKERVNFKTQPNPAAVIEEEALKVGGVTREQIMAYQPMSATYHQLIEILNRFVNRYDKTDKMYLVGYNNRKFDDDFFRAFFKQNGNEFFGAYFYADSHDLLVILSYHLRKERANLTDFKLKTVAKYLGIAVDEERLHDADYDMDLTRALYYKIPELAKQHELISVP